MPASLRQAITAGDTATLGRLLDGIPGSLLEMMGSSAGESPPVWAAGNAPQGTLIGMLDLFQAKGWSFDGATHQAILDELVRWGKTLALDAYIRRFAPPLDRTDTAGDAPLHTAAHAFQGDSFRMLVAHGASLRTKDGNDRTPLAALVAHLVESLDYLGGNMECADTVALIIELRVRHRAPLGCEGLPLFERLEACLPHSPLAAWAAFRRATKVARTLSRALPSTETGSSTARL